MFICSLMYQCYSLHLSMIMMLSLICEKNINVLMSNTYSVFYNLVEMQLRHEVSLNDGKYRPVSLRSITANFFDLQLKRESNIVVIIMIAIEIILTEGRPPPLMLPVKKFVLKRFTQSR